MKVLGKVVMGKSILVVEDNDDNMDLVKEILEEAGYNVLGTKYAENGIEILKRGVEINLVLMDVSLPKLNGYDATRQIRDNQELCKIPVILLTAHASQEDREKGVQAGCTDFLTKPIVDEDEFLSVIEKYV